MFSEQVAQKRGKSLIELDNELKKLSNEINATYQEMFNHFKQIIDYEIEIISLNFIVLDYKGNYFTEIILSICYKNIISLISCIKLIEQGFLGSAKIIFRNVYESLVIGKMLGITNDAELYNKWKSGTQISLKKDIFRKLVKTPSQESLEFWEFLNKYTHATVHSQDFCLDIDDKEIANCNSIITTLLVMNYTLINQFISKYYNHYLDLYFNPYFKELNDQAKQKNKFCISLIDIRCKRVIKEYQANWIIEDK